MDQDPLGKDTPVPPAPPSKELLESRSMPEEAVPPPKESPEIETSQPPQRSSGADSLNDFLRQRLEMMESELSKERDSARRFESLLRQQETVRGEADRQLKTILEQLKAEKTQREREEEKSRDQGRIEALEKRLDEMHTSWANLLKEAIAKRDSGAQQQEIQSEAAAAGMRALGESLAAVREDLAAMREGQNQIPSGLQQLISQFSALLTDRMADMDRRISGEVRKYEEIAAAWARERAAYSEVLEEQRHQIRQEYAKERIELQASIQARLQEFSQTFEKIQQKQEGDGQALLEIRELFAKTNEALRRPEKARDQILRDLEQDKRDLLKALEDRSKTLREYALERREVERSLGDSVMDLNRKLEAEREKQQSYDSQIAQLKLQLEAAQNKEALIQALKTERDNVLQSLVETTQKLQQSAAERAQSERAWEERNETAKRELKEANEKRHSTERQISDLEAKIQALSDHLARVIQEKDKGAGQSQQWKEERDKLLAELRTKEDLLSMLSSTFQNFLKK